MPERGLPRRPLAWIAVLYLVLWLSLDLVSQAFSTAPGVTVWYPPAALNDLLVLIFGPRWWPLLTLASLTQGWLAPQPLPPAALLAGSAIATLGPLAVRWWLNARSVDARLPRLRDVTWLVATAVVGVPMAGAALQVLMLAAFGRLPWAQTPMRALELWAGVATGAGMLLPALLVVLRHWPKLWAGYGAPTAPAPTFALNWRAWLEGVAEGAAMVLALWAGYGGPRAASLDYSYALFVPLLWIAARHGFERAALAVLALNVGVALLTYGQTQAQTQASGGLALQFGLITLTLSGLLMGAVVRERRQLAERLARQARHDDLTGLGNRRLLHERAAQALARTAGPAQSVGMLLLDLDDFKSVNDTLGHSAGDVLLREVGRRLVASVRPADTVARLGGDEFAVLLDQVQGPQEAAEIAERVLAAVQAPVLTEGQVLMVGASAGIALGLDAAQDSETLLRLADVALYRAKAGARGSHQLFDAQLDAGALAWAQLELDLRAAVAGGAFELDYQPVVDLRSGHVQGVEALLRWPRPGHARLTPDAFIGLAEERGLIVPLGRWVLETACREVASWPAPPSGPAVTLGVNVTAAQLRRPEVLDEVAAALGASGLAPERLMLELTESALLSGAQTCLQTLRDLRALGVQLAIDDFGTGYSNLSYLRHFPISVLKVDRSFFADVGRDHVATALARMLADLGHTLGLSSVAEGVETPEQLAQIRALGYSSAQGYLLSRPLSAGQARALVVGGAPLIAPDGAVPPA